MSLTALQTGNVQEFEALISANREPVRRFLFSLTGSNAVSEDLVQETILTLWNKRDKFEPGTNFRAWAFTTARFVALNYRRKAARSAELALPDEELIDRLATNWMEEDDLWEAESRHLPYCLERLQDRQRKIVVRRYVGKVSVQELADEQNLTPNAMSQLLFRIKRTLRVCVEQQLQLEVQSES